MPERQPSDRIAWLEDSVDGEHLGSIIGSSAKKTCGVESDYARRVRSLTQQPNLLAEALGSDRWRESDRRPGATGGLSAGAQNHV